MGIVEVEKNAFVYEAEYTISENVVTVYGEGGRESTQLGSMSEQQVARMLLNNLIRKGHIEPVKAGQ